MRVIITIAKATKMYKVSQEFIQSLIRDGKLEVWNQNPTYLYENELKELIK